ncbi:hypothetical protein LR090_02355 [Candidatus Bipolaricaulota bacterium]|nr:hypothetical protein [Candidatus Bipolaricaulota bacterium]
MIEVYLDRARSGRVMAHVLEPPGLGVRFESKAALEAELGRYAVLNKRGLRDYDSEG